MVLEVKTRTIVNNCPHCNYEVDCASGDTSPKEGDISICLKCSGISIFNNDLTIRLPTEPELSEALNIPNVKKYRELINAQTLD